MERWNAQSLIGSLEWRYAVKKFDPIKRLSEVEWRALRQALVLTPSSYGLQPWRFLHVSNRDLLKKLTPASWNQNQVEDCSHFLVFCGLKTFGEDHINTFIKRVAEVRRQQPESLENYRKMMVKDLVVAGRSKMIEQWASNQIYIALGNLMTSAAALGIDTCPMEGIEPEKYDQILGLPDQGLKTIVACAVGFRSHDDKYAMALKVRFKETDVVKEV
ncbi:MAG: NAD(P)H-dependent oxidoreductase [Deltaproteobacteria bacterium]|nr:NAD(P)H-dependent oxidoreductase [Deltaproteobacteria bacterium]